MQVHLLGDTWVAKSQFALLPVYRIVPCAFKRHSNRQLPNQTVHKWNGRLREMSQVFILPHAQHHLLCAPQIGPSIAARATKVENVLPALTSEGVGRGGTVAHPDPGGEGAVRMGAADKQGLVQGQLETKRKLQVGCRQ